MPSPSSARHRGSPVEFREGLATEIPLEDASVDLVWCERVLQHVPDAAAAVMEIARVLRPGGRALLLDSDHESRVESDMDPVVARELLLAFLGQMANSTAAPGTCRARRWRPVSSSTPTSGRQRWFTASTS